ncbi:MAG: FkbM family methyltransferase [Rhodothermales bacterium]
MSPFKSFVPEKYQFPVDGLLNVPVPGMSPLLLHVNPTCYQGKVLFWKGLNGFEPGMQVWFRRLAEQADSFFDVGANIGLYSLLAVKYNPKIKVVSFEPLPAAFTYLKRNALANQAVNVDAYQIALSDASGASEFHFSLNPKFLFVEDQLVSTGSLDEVQGYRTERRMAIPVTLQTLDDFMDAYRGHGIDLIKIDTEATEHMVIKGARKTFGTHRPIVFCEVLPNRVEAEIQQEIAALDYALFRIAGHSLVEVSDLRHDASSTNDFLFCPTEKVNLLESVGTVVRL